jgi:hypothetical protein
MWRRRSPSVMMPTSAPWASVTPTQPKPFEVRPLAEHLRVTGQGSCKPVLSVLNAL